MIRVSFMPYHLCKWYIQNWILQQKVQTWVYVHNVTNFIKKSRSKNTSAQTLQQQTDSANEGGTTEDSLQEEI